MPVLTRSALDESPLADLHELASELRIDGFRRLRRDDLVAAILERQGGDSGDSGAAGDTGDPADSGDSGDDEAPGRVPSRRSRGGTSRGGTSRSGASRGGRRGSRAAAATEEPEPERDAETAEGTVELLGNGAAFIRLTPPDPSDKDVYVSAAQVRRCELVSGDVVAGPVRAPRRSERYPSLLQVETINGAPAEQAVSGTRFGDLAAAFPSDSLPLGDGDATLKAIAAVAPLGKGSRATIVGPRHSGKTEALRRIAAALEGQDGLELLVVVAGGRPEEIGEWRAASPQPTVTVALDEPADAQARAIEGTLEQAKRTVARGGDVVVLIDTLAGLDLLTARRLLGSARNVTDGGSLTVIATAPAPVGGETTVIALDGVQAALGKFPAVDAASSSTLRPELLVSATAAKAIAKKRSSAVGR